MATIATVRYGRQFGWIGMVLVNPDAQGRGIGDGSHGLLPVH